MQFSCKRPGDMLITILCLLFPLLADTEAQMSTMEVPLLVREASNKIDILLGKIEGLESRITNIEEKQLATDAILEEKQMATDAILEGIGPIVAGIQGIKSEISSIEEKQNSVTAILEEKMEDIKEEIGNLNNDAKSKWQIINDGTKNDLANLQHLLDTDECSELTHNCSSMATCIDTRVSFRCRCKTGFTGDGYTCTDINECTGSNPCGANGTCTNTPGSYTCACDAGFQSNGITCEDMDECALGTHNCHEYAICNNTIGSYNCTCDVFHEGDGINCQERMFECSSPFKPVVGVGCIHIIEKSRYFRTSQSKCRLLGGDLFVAVDPDHYLRLARHFLATNKNPRHKYLWVGVKEGVWLSGRKVSPKEETPENPIMSNGTCSYTDGDPSEKFLLFTSSCNNRFFPLCAEKIF